MKVGLVPFSKLVSHYNLLNVYLKYRFLDPSPGDHVSVGMRWWFSSPHIRIPQGTLKLVMSWFHPQRFKFSGSWVQLGMFRVRPGDSSGQRG